MKLIIVESPHKSTTISEFLNKEFANNYVVTASKGQIEDLSTKGKNGFGVDVDNDFKPLYSITPLQRKTVLALKEKAKGADDIILASDPDREGEAIAYHLARVLGLDVNKATRIEFHEITKDAVLNALENPRTIDMNLVHAQEARRIIDRVIGFKLSNIMQKKIKAPSAGRVQSATLKLIVDHDKEIERFVPEEYWTLSLDVSNDNNQATIAYSASLNDGKIKNKEQCDNIINSLDKTVTIKNITKSVKTTESKPGFSTPALQIEAFNVYRMSVDLTSKTAQQLYEGVNGSEGLITYMRTDATRFSSEFVASAKAYIAKNYGEEYIGRVKVVSIKGQQDAHEAVRPTSLKRTPESIKHLLTPVQFNLYKLIYERTLASLMKGKKEEILSYEFVSNDVTFKTESKRKIFDGYTIIYKHDNDVDNVDTLKGAKVGDIFNIDKINNNQEFTKAPLHYNEGKVVKLMEDNGIGRPSTYSSTIQKLKAHKYIETKNGVLIATETGIRTATVLNKYFPKFVDVNYTASMEEDLDKVEIGSLTELKLLTDFYYPFMKDADEAYDKMYKETDKLVGRDCPKCGAPLVYKESKFGTFIGCSNFPTCKYTEKEEKPIEYTGKNCPKCGKPLVYKYNRKHSKFIGCSDYPHCDYSENIVRKKSFKRKTYYKYKYKKS